MKSTKICLFVWGIELSVRLEEKSTNWTDVIQEGHFLKVMLQQVWDTFKNFHETSLIESEMGIGGHRFFSRQDCHKKWHRYTAFYRNFLYKIHFAWKIINLCSFCCMLDEKLLKKVLKSCFDRRGRQERVWIKSREHMNKKTHPIRHEKLRILFLSVKNQKTSLPSSAWGKEGERLQSPTYSGLSTQIFIQSPSIETKKHSQHGNAFYIARLPWKWWFWTGAVLQQKHLLEHSQWTPLISWQNTKLAF